MLSLEFKKPQYPNEKTKQFPKLASVFPAGSAGVLALCLISTEPSLAVTCTASVSVNSFSNTPWIYYDPQTSTCNEVPNSGVPSNTEYGVMRRAVDVDFWIKYLGADTWQGWHVNPFTYSPDSAMTMTMVWTASGPGGTLSATFDYIKPIVTIGNASPISSLTNFAQVTPTALSTYINNANPRQWDGGRVVADIGNQNDSHNYTITANNGIFDTGAATTTISGTINDDVAGTPGKLFVSGNGTLIMNGVNSFSGGIEVTAGSTLQIANANALGSGDLSLIGTAGTPATVNMTGTTTISNAIKVAGDPVFNIATGTTTTISGAISDVGGGLPAGDIVLNNDGTSTGTLVLSGANSYSGGTVIRAGTLQLTGAGTLGSANGSISVNAGTLDLGGSVQMQNGGITLSAGTIQNGTLSTSNTINLLNGHVSANLAGQGSVVKSTSNTVTLSGTNSYTGSTTINDGILALSGSGSISNSAMMNHAIFDLTTASNTIHVASYLQSPAATLKMVISPATTQVLQVNGALNLAGTLNLDAASGVYNKGVYRLINATSVSGAFGSFVNNLSNYTTLGVSLAYSSNGVDLILGAASADTQSALQRTVSRLKTIYDLQKLTLTSNLTSDCVVFDKEGVCASLSGRVVSSNPAQHASSENSVFVGAYRFSDAVRIGIFVDQGLANQSYPSIRINNGTPSFGSFIVWTNNPGHDGFVVRLAGVYGDKTLTMTRDVIGSSEAGSGSSVIRNVGVESTIAYDLTTAFSSIVSPYAGLRWIQQSQNSYLENTTPSVFSPLTISRLSQSRLSVLMGLQLKAKLADDIGLFMKMGLEKNADQNASRYRATGVQGLTPIRFDMNNHIAPVFRIGSYYDLSKNQRISLEAGVEKRAFGSQIMKSSILTYSVGF